ncbi:MAG TPA: vitamin K epoxide reductase family protein [Solirubrobacteraceae bacterium]|nr:vitamin K epoxide reductase family protein [Solirubrobacteraceae bacterium]
MSARTLRIVLIVLAVVGMCWASYLTYVHYSGEAPVCSIKGNPCSQVQKSVYSELAGVPVALIGAIGYLLILGTLLASDGEQGRFATAALTLGGFGFSVYLTYREVFSLHKICEDCVASAVIMTILVCLSVWRFLRGDGAIPPLQPARADEGGGVEPATPLGSAS